MSTEAEMERKICEYLRENGSGTALKIAKHLKVDKKTVNKHLYKLMDTSRVFRTDINPPIWGLVENMDEKQTFKPEQKSPATRHTCEDKQVIDLLRSGPSKASQIARELGLNPKTVNKQLYSMKEETDDSLNQDRDHIQILIALSSRNFKEIKKLGKGTFGRVYKAKHEIDEKIYAVKRVHLTKAADSEVKALARLEHPNIVRYSTCWSDSDSWTSNPDGNSKSSSSASSSDPVTFERPSKEESDDVTDDVTSGMESLGVSEEYLFIQMEFCEGGTLTSWIKKKNYEENHINPQIYKIFRDIISGVEYIHSNNLIHRDLKPDNILFSADRKVKIGDFGLVAAQVNNNGDPIERSKGRGTPTYMSPEQKNQQNYDEKTDIFPLGLIWFEMLWKVSTGMERAKLWDELRNQTFPEGFCASFPTEHKFIKEMLCRDPVDRPHARVIREKLESFLPVDLDNLSQKTI